MARPSAIPSIGPGQKLAANFAIRNGSRAIRRLHPHAQEVYEIGCIHFLSQTKAAPIPSRITNVSLRAPFLLPLASALR